MKHLAIAFAAGVFLSGAALAQQGDRDNDRRSERPRHHHQHQSQQPDNGAPSTVPRSYAPRAGDPDPYAPKVGAPDPYASKAGAPNPYATQGGDPNAGRIQPYTGGSRYR